jgi:hypothetical protein
MANFITIQDGEYTINVDLISEIEWVSESEATVTMTTGAEYTCEDSDFWLLREAMGLDLPDLELAS